MTESHLLSTQQMALFVARGFLRFEAVVHDTLNERFAHAIENDEITTNPAGTPLSKCYADGCIARELLDLPAVAGIIHSLVGPDPRFDHQFVHVREKDKSSQHLHQDSTIDVRQAFDLQLFYFPHEITADMGGTRFVPGSHLRVVNEASIARYQNVIGQKHVVCPAGTVVAMHHGMWHGGGFNHSGRRRYMFKVRLNPAVRQCRLWNTADIDERMAAPQRIFDPSIQPDREDVQTILCTPEPWFEFDTGRLEFINRIKFWRYLLGDDSFDAHYWLTRLENDHPAGSSA